ncbi:UNVERIFIED_CONTAM: hypothetical protein FKN15_050355 [Acipenser sinensis]
MPVPTSKQLSEELSVFDIKCDDDLLDKMLEQCITHRIQEDDVVLEWVAFSTTRGGLALSLDNLHLFELEGSQKRALSTPENPQSKRILSVAPSPRLLLSPASFSPSATPSQKYGSRGGRGEVVCSFGAVQGTWRGQGDSSAQVQLYQGGKDSVTKSYKFMFQKLQDIREGEGGAITGIAGVWGAVPRPTLSISAVYLSSLCLSSVSRLCSSACSSVEPVVLLGQIGCDSNGKLNSKSVILEGDQEHSFGMQVPVDLSELREYSLFPGQGVPLPFHKPKEQSQEDMLEGAGQHMVLVACGPYTTSDSMNYEPLMDLIEVIKRDRPDVCLLVYLSFYACLPVCSGLLCLSMSVCSGLFYLSMSVCLFRSIYLSTPVCLSVQVCFVFLCLSVQVCFIFLCLSFCLFRSALSFYACLFSSGTQLVFVPSQRDVHHDFVFPQPPFHPSHLSQLSGEDRQRVLLLPDPCTLDLSGVVIGVTSTDILFHMGAEEISSYYPLYPPAEEMNVDYEQFQAYAQLPVTPDIFITPSELRYFIKDVIGCVCVNPGRLTKGQVGGTYGRLFIKRDASLEQGMERRSPCAAAEVVKI